MPDAISASAQKVHARSNASAASSGDGMPMIAMTIATPSAAPTWRATELRPVAVPKLSPGADATAAPLRLGNVAPAPTPRISMPGSHSLTNAGSSPTWVTNQNTPAPHSSAPKTST